MHIVVSWDIINTSDPGSWSMWNERMKEVIKPYAWVKALNTVYVVPIFGEPQRQAIIDGFRNVSAQSNGNIHVLVSPGMVGGQYAGVLPQNLWPELNKRSM